MDKKIGSGWASVRNTYCISMTHTWMDIFIVIGWLVFGLLITTFVLSIFAFMILWPLLLAWAINNLFATTIPLTFATWISIWIVIWATNMLFRRAAFTRIVRK
jgi:hypothetical protein